MVLWKKDTTRGNAFYVDLLPSRGPQNFSFEDLASIPKKDNEYSNRLRDDGNDKFRAKSWHEAMELYNKSLRFAIEGSENMNLAYANRSACFLHMEKFSECLADIRLAKEANYPQRLMPKLDQREAECLKMMKESNQVETKVKPVLSFDPDEKFPCMANVLEIRSNEEFAKHIVAKGDIEVGQTILVEDVFHFDASKCGQSSCETCLMFVTNLVPCPTCTDVMFCGTQCMESNDIHKLGCGASYHAASGYKRYVETILIAVSAFSNNIDELMKFVEKALDTRDFDSLEGVSGAQLKYGQFLKLFALKRDINFDFVSSTYQLLWEIPEVQRGFDTEQKQRFLTHLIWQHNLIIKTNQFAYGTFEEKQLAIRVLSIFSSLFNHACYHNATIGLCGNQRVGVVTRPIKGGDQLFIAYGGDLIGRTTEERRIFLRNKHNFECKCSKCVPCFKRSVCRRMRSDPVFQLAQPKNINYFLDLKERQILKDNLCKFMSKYGRLPWSDEIATPLLYLEQFIHLDLFDAFNFIKPQLKRW